MKQLLTLWRMSAVRVRLPPAAKHYLTKSADGPVRESSAASSPPIWQEVQLWRSFCFVDADIRNNLWYCTREGPSENFLED